MEKKNLLTNKIIDIILTTFSYIGKPMVEAISGIKVEDDANFYRKRIASVVTVLQRGMLK